MLIEAETSLSWILQVESSFLVNDPHPDGTEYPHLTPIALHDAGMESSRIASAWKVKAFSMDKIKGPQCSRLSSCKGTFKSMI